MNLNRTQIILKEQSGKTLMFIGKKFVTSFVGDSGYAQRWLKKNILNYEIKVI